MARPATIFRNEFKTRVEDGIAAELEKSRLLAARLLDQVRFQHAVLAEIHDLASSAADDSRYRMNLISIKAAVAARAAAISGLLS